MKVIKLITITEDLEKNLMQFSSDTIKWQTNSGVGKDKIIPNGKSKVKFIYEIIDSEMIVTTQEQDYTRKSHNMSDY